MATGQLVEMLNRKLAKSLINKYLKNSVSTAKFAHLIKMPMESDKIYNRARLI